jgi:prolyl 4-hydroxylase
LVSRYNSDALKRHRTPDALLVSLYQSLCSRKERHLTLQLHTLDNNLTFVIPQFLSPEECDHYIALSEELGYDDAPITTSVGFIMRKDIRDNYRVMLDSVPMAQQLYERAEPFLPKTRLVFQLCGLNERLRFYRYDVGQKFAHHVDGCFRRSDQEESLFTFMVYLNDDFEGGETKFYDQRHRLHLSVKPEKGKALIFWHNQVHEGAPVEKGRKYVVRTDVMYRKMKGMPRLSEPEA